MAAIPNFGSGYYSSLVTGSSTTGNLISSFAWGMIADRFGRKPVMLASVFATGVFSITFGLAKTLPSALASRCVVTSPLSLEGLGVIEFP